MTNFEWRMTDASNRGFPVRYPQFVIPIRKGVIRWQDTVTQNAGFAGGKDRSFS
jgi:hypothetical protein